MKPTHPTAPSISPHGVAFLVLLALVLPTTPGVQAQTLDGFTYQGYLLNGDGNPVDGTVNLALRLYETTSGGDVLWSETQTDVVVSEGIFSVRVGSVASLDAVLFGEALWLGVSVNGGSELVPRTALGSAPRALSLRGLRVEPGNSQNFPSPTLIGGYAGNALGEGVNGAVIGGGGGEGSPNMVGASFTTIGGGGANQANALYATVSGGYGNLAEGDYAAIVGGDVNKADGEAAFIGGGIGNSAAAAGATVGGGGSNKALGAASTVGGGSQNEASGESATVSGGQSNTASDERATIAGGHGNRAGRFGTVGGGQLNRAEGFSTTVAGGTQNVASGEYATVAGGQGNEATGNHSYIGGGRNNRAEGLLSMVPGGFQTHATGFGSFAAGYNARALHDGAFVWTDTEGIPTPFSSTAEDQFLIRAAGGVGIGTNTPKGALHLTETDIGIDPGDVTEDALIVEGNAPVITLYGNFQQNTRPGLVLAGVENGNVGDKWGIVREYFGFNGLHFTYGLNQDHTQNATVMKLSSQQGAESRAFTATNDLGATGTPAAGGHYRDNVVYAWANVQGNGTVASSYGCTVSRRTGFGSYRVTFNRQLPDGVSAIVTVQTLNDPVIATAVANQSQADVATKVFNGAAFVAADYGFYIQVVGRP